MKEKLTISIDGRTIRKAKRYARRSKASVSQIVENYLNTLCNKSYPSFTTKWRGKFNSPSTTDDPRMDYLLKHHQ